MSRICLYAKKPNYGAASLVAEAIKNHTNYNLTPCYGAQDILGFHKYGSALYWGLHKDKVLNAMNNADHLMLVGATSYDYFWAELAKQTKRKWKTITVILTDSNYFAEAVRFNKSFTRKNVVVYAMPDLFVYAKYVNAIPFYQPVDVADIKMTKPNNTIKLCHSPRSLKKKGTHLIRKVYREIAAQRKDVQIDIIRDVSWQECLKRKASAHIFVDQVIKGNPDVPQNRWKTKGKNKYAGGIGKSGLEAMALNCLTLTSGEPVDTSPHFPPPPMEWVTGKTVKSRVKFFVKNPDERERRTAEQFSWAQQYLSPSFVSQHLTRHMS